MRRLINLCYVPLIICESLIVLYLIEYCLPTQGYEMWHLILWLAALATTICFTIIVVAHQWTENERLRRKALITTTVVGALIHFLIWYPIIGESQY